MESVHTRFHLDLPRCIHIFRRMRLRSHATCRYSPDENVQPITQFYWARWQDARVDVQEPHRLLVQDL